MMIDKIKLEENAYRIDREYYSKYDVKKGLRNSDGSGVLAGLTKVSEVHGYIIYEDEKMADEGSLAYRGHDINILARKCGINKRYKFEEAVFLLLYGRLPEKEEFEEFLRVISEYANLPEGFTEDTVIKAPSQDVMNKLSRGVLTLYSYDDDPDSTTIDNVLKQSLMLIARIPTLAAYDYRAKRHYYDGESLILHSPRKEYSIAENILAMIRSDAKFTKEEAEILDLCLLLHAEHGGGNNSAFTCRVLTSSGTDTYSAISGAINALKGPKHGGANYKVVKMMDDIKENVSDWTDEEEVRAYLNAIMDKKVGDKSGLIYGVGHAVYTRSDPRTVILKKKAKILAHKKGFEKEFALYELIEKIAPNLVYERKGRIKEVSCNVDFYSGFVYTMLNIPSEMYTPLFAIARNAGWCAHRLEELITSKKILRPAYKSICKIGAKYVEKKDRGFDI